MERHTKAFVDNLVTGDTLLDIDEDDLKYLGVIHRSFSCCSCFLNIVLSAMRFCSYSCLSCSLLRCMSAGRKQEEESDIPSGRGTL